MKLSLRNILPLIFVIVLSFWTIKPLLHSGFFPMHDDTQPSRVYEMAKALSSGQFPVRWVGELGYGYGYPLFNFYAPLPYYIGAILNLAGFDILVATKIMIGVGIILAGVTMYFLLESLVGELAASVGSLLYMYAPYHAIDIYVRGAVGEFYAMAFLPLVLLGVIKIIQVQTIKSGILIGSIGFVGILLSHNILGMITSYFLIAGLLILLIISLIPSPRGRPIFKALLFTFLLGFGLSAFFILPAVFERDFTRVSDLTLGTSNFTNHFIYLDQLWSSPWGYAGSAPGRTDGMSFMIGKIHLLLGLLSIPIIFYLYKAKKLNKLLFTVYCLLFTVLFISIFFMLAQSKFLWDLLPAFAFIQYPWRFLVFAVFGLSAMVSVPFIFLKKKLQLIMGLIAIIIIIIFNTKYFVPQEYLLVNSDYYTSTENLGYRISKISDEYLPKEFIIPEEANFATESLSYDPNFQIIETVKDTPTEKIYLVDSKEAKLKVTNITFFPGWKVQTDIDNKPYNVNGRLAFYTFPAQYKITFKFTDTPIRIAANTISLLSLFLLGYIIVSSRTSYAKKKKS